MFLLGIYLSKPNLIFSAKKTSARDTPEFVHRFGVIRYTMRNCCNNLYSVSPPSAILNARFNVFAKHLACPLDLGWKSAVVTWLSGNSLQKSQKSSAVNWAPLSDTFSWNTKICENFGPTVYCSFARRSPTLDNFFPLDETIYHYKVINHIHFFLRRQYVDFTLACPFSAKG